MTPCYTCRERPAGNDYAGSHSAYCGKCQPRDTRPRPSGSQCYCSPCREMFATLTDFDSHRETGTCRDPASLGMEMSGDAWGTPEGNANRTRKAARMEAVRAYRS
jgi:hypothetical protein